jgi:hypothetical protein
MGMSCRVDRGQVRYNVCSGGGILAGKDDVLDGGDCKGSGRMNTFRVGPSGRLCEFREEEKRRTGSFAEMVALGCRKMELAGKLVTVSVEVHGAAEDN